ncbi:ANTAR domain-containing protein [Mycobacterium sp. URHB0021]
MQYTLGEGPCFDAYLDARPQFHPELASVTPQTSRWPTFAAEAAQLGVHALFAFPIPHPRQPMGVLELYRRSTGSLPDGECAAAAECASAIAHRLQSNWDDHVARFGNADQAIDALATNDAALSEPADPFTRTQIHVAAGMVAIDLRVNPDEAVDRLRAYSYACGRRVSSVAADIIARRLTLHDEPDG